MILATRLPRSRGGAVDGVARRGEPRRVTNPDFVSIGDDRFASTEGGGYGPTRSALRWLAGAWVAELALTVLSRLLFQLALLRTSAGASIGGSLGFAALVEIVSIGSTIGGIAIDGVILGALLRMRRTPASADVDTPAVVGAAAAGGSIVLSIATTLLSFVLIRTSSTAFESIEQILQLFGLAVGLTETAAILWVMARLARAASTRVPRALAAVLGAALAWRYLSWIAIAVRGRNFAIARENPLGWLAISLLVSAVAQGVLVAFALGLDKKLAGVDPGASAAPRIVLQPEESLAELGTRNMIRGGIAFVAGTVITVGSLAAASGGGTYVVAWGAIAYGAIQFFRGVSQRSRARRS